MVIHDRQWWSETLMFWDFVSDTHKAMAAFLLVMFFFSAQIDITVPEVILWSFLLQFHWSVFSFLCNSGVTQVNFKVGDWKVIFIAKENFVHTGNWDSSTEWCGNFGQFWGCSLFNMVLDVKKLIIHQQNCLGSNNKFLTLQTECVWIVICVYDSNPKDKKLLYLSLGWMLLRWTSNFFPIAVLIVLQSELAQNIGPNFVIKEVFSCYNYSSFARSSSPSFVYFFLLSLSSSFMVRFPLCLLCPQCHNLALAIFSVHLSISCFLLPFCLSFLTSFFIESASIIMAESSNYLPEF